MPTREPAKKKAGVAVVTPEQSDGVAEQPSHMQKLRGTGNTFSTSGKHWQPFMLNPKVAKRNAKLHRLKRKGLLPTKAELQQLSANAVQARRKP